MKIALSTFAGWALRERLGTDTAAALEAALVYYAGRAESNWGDLRRPDMYARIGHGSDDIVFELDPPPPVEAALRREACRSGVPLEQIASHAVLVYLADLDAASEAAQRLLAPLHRDLPSPASGGEPASPAA